MNTMIEVVRQPWPWWFSGMMIAAVMFITLYFGQSFGFSANFRTLCSMAGLGKKIKFFDFNWKTQIWNLIFLLGTLTGGFITRIFLSNDSAIDISEKTIHALSALGFSAPSGVQPDELFSAAAFLNLKTMLLLAIGGFLVGFGARYAGGCTSGHAISGLSDLQIPSLIAVIGFFIGGLIMTHVLFPIIF
jgi:uncharacterized membrane protein YedE/YeeE